jgi:hypothetical protein
MTIADLMRICLEFDQQCISSRPSEWGKAALMLRTLAEHLDYAEHEPPFKDTSLLGDWSTVDTSQVNAWKPPVLNHSVLPLVDEIQALRDALSDLIQWAERQSVKPEADVITKARSVLRTTG